jgi:NADH-quinone oxidoreductase subunit A
MTVAELYPFLLFVLLAGVTAGGMLAVGHFVGPRKPNPAKDQPFECGNLGSDPREGHIPVHFYRVAILFVLFDIEIAFLYPWAIRFREYGWVGLASMAFFVGFLFLAFVVLWKKGVLEWD